MKKKIILGLILVSTSLQLAASQDDNNWLGAVAFGATVVAYTAQNLYANYKADASEETIDHDMSVDKTQIAVNKELQNCSARSALSDKFAAVLQQDSQDDNDKDDSISTGSDSAKNELGHLLIEIVAEQKNIVAKQKNHESRLAEIERNKSKVRKNLPSCHMNFGSQDDSEVAVILTNTNNTVDVVIKKSSSPVKVSSVKNSLSVDVISEHVSPVSQANSDESTPILHNMTDNETVWPIKAVRSQTIVGDGSLSEEHVINDQSLVASDFMHVIVTDESPD